MDYQIETRTYPDGRRGEFGKKNGKNHGPWRTFFRNGQPHIERTFINGREHGVTRTWSEQGVLLDEKEYQDGALHGHWRVWNEAGELVQDLDFRFGEPVTGSDSAPAPRGTLEQLLEGFLELTSGEARVFYARAVEQLRSYSIHPIHKTTPVTPERVGSCLGTVTHAPRGTTWPEIDGKPMVPLIQIRVDELPVVPPPLKDIALLCVFGPPEYPHADGVDELVTLVASSLDELIALDQPKDSLRRKPVAVSWMLDAEEYPDPNDIPPGLKAYIEDNEPNSEILSKSAKAKTKVGGWPGWIQTTKLRGLGDLVVQIDSIDFDDWAAGDATVFYCFRRPGSAEIWSYAEMY